MDRRAAKREACARAASALQTNLDDGWETLDMYGPDRERVARAIGDLVTELDRRAGPPTMTPR